MVIRALRQAGFSVAMAVHAFTLLDSFIFGFALQEQTLPFESTDQVDKLAIEILASSPLTTIPTSPSPLPSTWARPATTSPASSTSVSI